MGNLEKWDYFLWNAYIKLQKFGWHLCMNLFMNFYDMPIYGPIHIQIH